jgi:hypothetical protein
MIDFWPNPGWRFVQSKVFKFLPGYPLACSVQALPAPDDSTGILFEQSKTVVFQEVFSLKL